MHSALTPTQAAEIRQAYELYAKSPTFYTDGRLPELRDLLRPHNDRLAVTRFIASPFEALPRSVAPVDAA